MNEKIFITGGAGFIGSHIAQLFSDSGYDIVIYDNLKTGIMDNIKQLNNIDFINGDITDLELLKKSMRGCSKVFHFAAEISVPDSMKQPLLTETINTHGTINVLDAMIANNVGCIVFASSAAVYGDSEVCPKTVIMNPEPKSPYAISKLSGEHYINMYSKVYDIKGVVTRFFNVFGERQKISSGYAAAVPIFIHKALRGEDLTIYGDGEQTRDFIYVKDLAKYLKYLSEGCQGVFNIGYGKYITINELADKIVSITKSASNIKHENVRAGDIKHSYADVSGIKKFELELTGFENGLSATIEYFKDSLKKIN